MAKKETIRATKYTVEYARTTDFSVFHEINWKLQDIADEHHYAMDYWGKCLTEYKNKTFEVFTCETRDQMLELLMMHKLSDVEYCYELVITFDDGEEHIHETSAESTFYMHGYENMIHEIKNLQYIYDEDPGDLPRLELP